MKKSTLNSFAIILIMTIVGFTQNTDDAIRILDKQIGFGGRAIGMGGAYIAVADDYSAIYWNPAGLAQMRKTEVWLELSHVRYGNDISYPYYHDRGDMTYSSAASQKVTKFNSIGFAFPVPTYRGSLVFSLGYQRVKDFEYANEFLGVSDQGSDRLSFIGVDPNNPDDVYDFFGEDVEKEGYLTDEGSINQWSAAGAIDVTPNMSLGLGLNFWTGSSEYAQLYHQLDKFNYFDVYPADFDEYSEERTLSSKYSSFNAKLGSLFRLGRQMRLSIGIESPQTFSIEEEYFLDSKLKFDDGFEDNFDDADAEESGLNKYKVKMPFRFSIGASLSLGTILVSGSAEYMDWTQVKFKTDELKDLNRYLATDYRETVKLRLGGEIDLPSLDSQFRAGAIYDPTPLVDRDSDWDRKYLTIGYGLLIEKILKIDLAYVHGMWKQATFDDLTPEGTEEDVTYQKLLLTISYRY
jgi:long-subunit fatty acid transport protein